MTRDEIFEAAKNIQEYCAIHVCDNECPFYKSGWGGNCKLVGNTPLQWDILMDIKAVEALREEKEE